MLVQFGTEKRGKIFNPCCRSLINSSAALIEHLLFMYQARGGRWCVMSNGYLCSTMVQFWEAGQKDAGPVDWPLVSLIICRGVGRCGVVHEVWREERGVTSAPRESCSLCRTEAQRIPPPIPPSRLLLLTLLAKPDARQTAVEPLPV